MLSNFPPTNNANNDASYPQYSLGNGQIPPYYPPEYVHTNNNNIPGGQAISGGYSSANQAIPMTPGIQVTPGIQGNFYGQQTIAGQLQGPPPPPVSKGPFQWYKRQSRGKKLGIGCGSLLLVLMMCTCSLAANVGSKQAGNTSVTPTVKSVILAQSTPAEVLKKDATVVVTHLIKPTMTAKKVATATPNQVVQPTATPIPVQPTLTPIPVRPTPKPPVQPTPTPVQSTGVNGNPWGYNFNLGNYITQPPATFCTYFVCIKNFLNGNGYVVECQDTMYSLSGGIRGACSYHGGVLQALYSH